jgi:hypothetical protein
MSTEESRFRAAADFNALQAKYRAEFRPATPEARLHVEILAHSEWLGREYSRLLDAKEGTATDEALREIYLGLDESWRMHEESLLHLFSLGDEPVSAKIRLCASKRR